VPIFIEQIHHDHREYFGLLAIVSGSGAR